MENVSRVNHDFEKPIKPMITRRVQISILFRDIHEQLNDQRYIDLIPFLLSLIIIKSDNIYYERQLPERNTYPLHKYSLFDLIISR
jgi:hypothetical protein